MELAEQLVELAEVLADITADVTSRTELKIRQLKELKVFDSLRLPIEDAAGLFTEILKVKASLIVYYLGSSVS